MDETARDVGVVVFHENHPVLEAALAAEFVNLLDERLAAFILRMRFPCKDELDRARLIVEQTLETLLIAEEQRTAFVGGEPASEPDR